jgi:hypothetical protein
MNPVTFNDPFRSLLDELVDAHGFCSKDWKWYGAPLFNYTVTEEREMELNQWRLDHPDYRMALPFETVRLALSQVDAARPERGRYVVDYLAATQPPAYEKLYTVMRIKRLFDETMLGRGKIMEFIITDLEWQSRQPVPDGVTKGYLTRYNAMGRYDGKWIMEPIGPVLADHLNEMITAAVNCLVAFAIDAMLPNTHIAAVTPSKPCKSVQWRKAREHYTLISHGHPANTATMREGSTVRVDEQLERERMAHARRAHFRTLKSDRFRFAKGKQILVRATWVGPKEWRDEGSGQIYRILEPVRTGP